MRFPSQFIQNLAALSQMSAKVLGDLQNQLANSAGTNSVPAADKTQPLSALEVFQFLAQVYRHQTSLADKPIKAKAYIEDLLNQLELQLHFEHKESLNSDIRNSLSSLLETALFADRPLGLMFKSNDLKTFYPQNFSRVQIVSDIRPLFSSDDSTATPVAAMITHSMRISYQRKIGEFDDFFVGLETEELLELKECVDRALDKSKILDDFLKKSGYQFLKEESDVNPT